MKEEAVSQHVLYEAAKLNINLMRNNVGAVTYVDLETKKTTHLRFGLMNESEKQNKQLKSSDYIGICPTWAYVDGVGWGWLGVFTAIEMKKSTWKFSHSDERAVAQAAFHDIVRGYGGFAGFATGPEDVARICGR